MIGRGTTLHYGDVGGTGADTEIEKIIDLNFPELTVADVKDTNYTTPDATHGYLPGYIEGGVINVVKDFVPADQDALRGLLRQRKNWVITYGDDSENPGGTDSFEGYVNKIGGAVPNEDKVTVTFSIKVCTLPVYAPPA